MANTRSDVTFKGGAVNVAGTVLKKGDAAPDFTLPLVQRYVHEVVTVSDDEVAQAMVLLLERSKLVV